MNSSLQSHTSRPGSSGVNPFARALAEARGGSPADPNFANTSAGNGQMPNLPGSESELQNQAEQQRLMKEQAEKKRQRELLHRQINPVEMHDVFKAKETQVKKEIDKLRYELKALSQEIAAFHSEIEISVMSEVPTVGQEGKYHLTFFQQLREWIMLLRQKIHSARTWATQFQQKKRKSRGGLLIDGKGADETKAVWDRMGQERSNLYSSG